MDNQVTFSGECYGGPRDGFVWVYRWNIIQLESSRMPSLLPMDPDNVITIGEGFKIVVDGWYEYKGTEQDKDGNYVNGKWIWKENRS